MIRKLICFNCIIISSCSTFTPTIDNCNNLYTQQNYAGYIDKCSAVAMNDAASQYRLYQIYKSGVGGSIDLQKANYFLQQSATLGYVPAMLDTCKGYYTGSIGVQSGERTLYWCEKAYQRGRREAISYLANVYYKQKQYDSALYYFQQLDPKSSQVEYIIGTIYLQQDKTPENGWYWIRKAYDRKNSDAKTYVNNLTGKYGKCNIGDVYFNNNLSYSEAMQVCRDINAGKLTSETAVMHTKRFFRSVF